MPHVDTHHFLITKYTIILLVHLFCIMLHQANGHCGTKQIRRDTEQLLYLSLNAGRVLQRLRLASIRCSADPLVTDGRSGGHAAAALAGRPTDGRNSIFSDDYGRAINSGTIAVAAPLLDSADRAAAWGRPHRPLGSAGMLQCPCRLTGRCVSGVVLQDPLKPTSRCYALLRTCQNLPVDAVYGSAKPRLQSPSSPQNSARVRPVAASVV